MATTVGRNQRRVRLVRAIVSFVLLASCSGGSGGSVAPPAQGPVVALRGGDISALERIEQAGGVFRVSGVSVWGGGSRALFDDGGNVLPAASEFMDR